MFKPLSFVVLMMLLIYLLNNIWLSLQHFNELQSERRALLVMSPSVIAKTTPAVVSDQHLIENRFLSMLTQHTMQLGLQITQWHSQMRINNSPLLMLQLTGNTPQLAAFFAALLKAGYVIPTFTWQAKTLNMKLMLDGAMALKPLLVQTKTSNASPFCDIENTQSFTFAPHLNHVALASLKMTGFLIVKQKPQALLTALDGSFATVQIGEKIGQEQGTITDITPNALQGYVTKQKKFLIPLQ